MDERSDPRKRSYRMVGRVEAAEETRRRIMRAAIELYSRRDHDSVSLQDVAGQAGVTVQTVLRRFGSKEQLLTASADLATSQVLRQRSTARPGDIAGAVENLLDHYEEWGERVLRLLAQEDRVPAFRVITDRGRELHRDWVEHTFAPLLPTGDAVRRARRLAQLTAICDVTVWKLLRRDLGLNREQTALALREMIAALQPASAGG